MSGGADRSSIEIKVLLKNLDPTKTNLKHKDRLRRLNKFRNYVTTKPSPEFYDDDYSLLLLGSESPTAMEDDDLMNVTLYGLLRAAGTPSTDHKDSLKRSARPTISLLRYLCLEFESSNNNNNLNKTLMGELNGFAECLCGMNVPQLRTLRIDIHIGKGDNESGSRGGSKDDACALLAILLARHTDTDYETQKPLKMKDFLPESRGQAEFDAWLSENASQDVRMIIKENVAAAEGGKVGGGFTAATPSTKTGGEQMPIFGDSDDDEDEDDLLGAFGKKDSNTPSKKSGGGGEDNNPFAPMGSKKGGRVSKKPAPDGKPMSWAETEMASETERASGAIFVAEEVSISSLFIIYECSFGNYLTMLMHLLIK